MIFQFQKLTALIEQAKKEKARGKKIAMQQSWRMALLFRPSLHEGRDSNLRALLLIHISGAWQGKIVEKAEFITINKHFETIFNAASAAEMDL